MSESPEPGPQSRAQAAAERARRRRLEEIFGDEVPEQVRDDADAARRSAEGGQGTSDTWWRDQVPPHHG